MLYSPSLHGMKALASVSTFAPASDLQVMYDASAKTAAKMAMSDARNLVAFAFSLTAFPEDSTSSLTAVTASTSIATGYKSDLYWPFAFTCTGIRVTAGGLQPSAGSPVATFDVFRNSNSVITNSSSVTGAITLANHVTSSTGVKGQTSITAPHASQTSWSQGDRVRTFCATVSSLSGNAARVVKVIIYGYRT